MSGGKQYKCRLVLMNERDVVYTDTLQQHQDQSFPGTIEDGDLATETTLWLSELLNSHDEVCRGTGVRLLGRHLYHKVFTSPAIAPAFEETYRRFEDDAGDDSDTTLRLEIVFHPAAEKLAQYPWEFLYYADPEDRTRSTFLAGDRRSLVLTREVKSQQGLTSEPREKPHILFAVCTQPGENLNSDRMLEFLENEGSAGQIKLQKLEADFQDLSKAIEDGKPDVVHILAHGAPGVLFMRRNRRDLAAAEAEYDVRRSQGGTPSPPDRDEPITADKTVTLFEEHKPDLVFLQSCYGGAAPVRAAFARDDLYNTALAIVKSGVPAVVAMQYDVEAGVADTFATAFYEELTTGSTIGRAVWCGRKKLAQTGEDYWAQRNVGTPVVYVVDDAAVVAAREKPGDEPSVEFEGGKQPPVSGSRKCPRCGWQFKYQACPRCHLRMCCPNCLVEYELPIDGFCGNCTQTQPQEKWPRDDERPGEPRIEEMRRTGSAPGAADRFQAGAAPW